MAIRLGELLLREKRVTPAQLQEALNYQKANGGRLAASRSISAPPDCIGKLYSVRLFGEWLMCSGQPSYSDTIDRCNIARCTISARQGQYTV